MRVGEVVIGTENKWLQMIFKKKEETLGVESVRYKVRLVVKCYSQRGVDFNELFSLVVKYTSIHVLLVMVVWFDLELKQLDVKITFLHAELEEQIYIHQPEGFSIEGKKYHVCKLKKSLYGLKDRGSGA